jgi:hypothetical protein
MATFDEVFRQLQQQAGYAAGQARQAFDTAKQTATDVALIKQANERHQREMQALADALEKVKGSGGGFGSGSVGVDDRVRYIESIPGRRIPFDLMVAIPIPTNSIALAQGTKTISQDGPFVAVGRMATFQSAFQFQRVDPVTQDKAVFQGRTFGRFRPMHSVWDLNDASAGVFPPTTGIAQPGTGAPIVAAPSNMSSFRSMEFDGLIQMLNQGAGYPRDNQDAGIPSAFYSESLNAIFQLGALDFFERGETIQWKVTPTHVNNPPAGNLSGYAAGGLFPFLASQYDVQEGVNDELDPDATTDPVTRLPDGILWVGLHGIKIVQPPGPVRLT